LKVESKYRHLDTFSDHPGENLYVLYSFARANHANANENEICLDRAIHYYERAKERIDADDYDRRQSPKSLMPDLPIGM